MCNTLDWYLDSIRAESNAPMANRPNLESIGPLLTDREATEYLRVSPCTLKDWRYLRRGPDFIKLGSSKNASVRYSVAALQRWLCRHAISLKQESQ